MSSRLTPESFARFEKFLLHVGCQSVCLLAVYFKDSSNGILPSPHSARLGCGGAKMSGSAAHANNFKFFFGGIQIRVRKTNAINPNSYAPTLHVHF